MKLDLDLTEREARFIERFIKDGRDFWTPERIAKWHEKPHDIQDNAQPSLGWYTEPFVGNTK